jgi:hypothetical protein
VAVGAVVLTKVVEAVADVEVGVVGVVAAGLKLAVAAVAAEAVGQKVVEVVAAVVHAA